MNRAYPTAAALNGSGWFLRALGASVVALATTPFGAMIPVLVYLDLRVRKSSSLWASSPSAWAGE